jgi:DNA-binding GntR family transcriptional regulator
MEGAWPLGERLEAGRLADDLGVSMTPVRDSLNRLAGERLVDFRPGEGYRVARVSEGTLRDLFDFNFALLELALRAPHSEPPRVDAGLAGLDHADRVAALFEVIVLRSRNTIIAETVCALSERLHATRMLDPHLFPEAIDEVRELEEQLSSGSRDIRARLASYHARRREAAGQLIQLLEQGRN